MYVKINAIISYLILIMAKFKIDKESLSESILGLYRRQNLYEYIHSNYGKLRNGDLNTAPFHHDLRNELEKISDDRFETIRSRLYKVYEGGSLSAETADVIERALKLQKESLSGPIQPKAPAYVLITCNNQFADELYQELKECYIVDEAAQVAGGDADIFIRIFGTPQEIKHFLFTKLVSLIPDKDVRIKTKTLFSFEQINWQRYPTREHPSLPVTKIESTELDNSNETQ